MSESIDRQTLRLLISDMSPGGEAIVGDLLKVLCRDFPGTLERLQDALVAQEFDQLRDIAHRAKSGCATLGALRLTELCASVEQEAAAQHGSALTDLLVEIEAEWAAVEETCRPLMAFLSGRS